MRLLTKISLCLMACLIGFTSAHAEDVSLKMPNELTALGSLDLAEGESLSGAHIILLVHGTLAHKDMDFVSTQRELLNERGLNVLAVNLTLGLDERKGMYECAKPHNHRHRDAVIEISNWINWLSEKGVSDITLMGHSRGGNQVVWAAIEKPNPLVSKVISVAPMTWEPQRETVDYMKRTGVGLLQVLHKMMNQQEAGKEMEMVELTDFLYCPKTTVNAATFLDYYAAEPKFNTPDLVQGLDLPVLVVAGDKDVVVEDLPYQMSKVKKANIQFETVSEADHMFLDFAAEDLADLVEGFVTQ